MTVAYLWLNVVLYAVFSVWCTVKPTETARSVGYAVLEGGGRSEYLVVYGGLQLGLAIAYAIFAMNPQWHRVGLLFSLAVYGAIVLFRGVTLWLYAPVPALTWGVAGLELGLLVAAAALLLTRQP